MNVERRLIFHCTKEVPRIGEGSCVKLLDGSILLAYTSFIGNGEDHDKATIYIGILDPSTGAVSESHEIVSSHDALNQMIASLERLSDGSIGLVYVMKSDRYKSEIHFAKSYDEGLSWSKPLNCTSGIDEMGYFGTNNDRLRQFSNGRIAVPIYYIHDFGGGLEHSWIGILYSDDMGATWKKSALVRVMDENVIMPQKMNPEAKKRDWDDDKSWQHPHRTQEAGVEELADGRIYLYCRTPLGYMYHTYSEDKGLTWGALKPVKDIISPLSPQSIRRIPGSQRLICIYNDRSSLSWGDENWSWRTLLTLSVSDNSGITWRKICEIENVSHNYCYTSILFTRERIILTDYESENLPDGTRRNLASLKMQVLDLCDIIDA